MLSDGLPREMSTRPHSLHRFDEPVTNRSKWNGKRRLACDDVRRPPSKTYGCTLEVEGTNRVDRPAVTATITRGLRLGRSEVLRSLRHHTSDRLEEVAIERESVRLSIPNGQERAIVSQISTGTVLKAALGTFPERQESKAHGISRVDYILNEPD